MACSFDRIRPGDQDSLASAPLEELVSFAEESVSFIEELVSFAEEPVSSMEELVSFTEVSVPFAEEAVSFGSFESCGFASLSCTASRAIRLRSSSMAA